MDAFLFCCSVYLLLGSVILCKTEPMSCHTCTSKNEPKCSDAFGGGNNTFLEECKNDTNMTVSCRKEVNDMVASKPTLYLRYCYYTDGFTPEEEYEARRVTYYTCMTYGCNGQSSIKSAIVTLGIITIFGTLLSM